MLLCKHKNLNTDHSTSSSTISSLLVFFFFFVGVVVVMVVVRMGAVVLFSIAVDVVDFALRGYVVWMNCMRAVWFTSGVVVVLALAEVGKKKMQLRFWVPVPPFRK
jgi:hypothetical protein